jgi:hypothetical protein
MGSNSSQASGPANDPISRHGINDPVSGVDVKLRNHDNATPHEREQRAADVRAEPAADKAEPFLPEALRASRQSRSTSVQDATHPNN